MFEFHRARRHPPQRGVAGDVTFQGLDPAVVAVAHAIDQFAIIFYAVELVLRIISYGTKPWMFFANPWNVFDFLVVGLIPFLNDGTLIFRLVRLLPSCASSAFLPEARILMLSMVKSVAPLANLAVLIASSCSSTPWRGCTCSGRRCPTAGATSVSRCSPSR